MRPRLHVTLAWMLVGLYAAGIFILSSLSHPSAVLSWHVPHLDKLCHFVEYASFTLVLMYAVRTTDVTRPASVLILWVIGLALIYGASDEIHQAFTPERSMSIYDFLADAVGVVMVASLWPRAQRLWPLLAKL